ncbi:MAG: peptidoglycan-binding protein, partial [Acidobacteria bacterium]|nr:peptidoglycan-binding protein [Acidobacteriota bacterium]
MSEHATRNFRLKGLVARNVGVEPDDTVLTKRALKRLGFYQVPDYGLTPWPDGGMFQAIESFQERNRLKVDGVMAPGEETEAWLGKALRGEKRRISDIFGLGSQVGPGRANRPEDVMATKRALALAGHYPAELARDPSDEADSLLARGISGFQSIRGLKEDGLMGPGGETERELERTVQFAQQAQGKKDASGIEAIYAPERSDGEPRKPDLPDLENPKFSIPEGGVIRSDSEGDGNFRSQRTHGPHEGVDITVRPGQMVPAPIDGVVIKKSLVYHEDNEGLHSTHIEGTGKWTGYTVKMFYMNNAALKEGAPVKRGALLGPAQDVSLRHEKKNMTPHIHYEVR